MDDITTLDDLKKQNALEDKGKTPDKAQDDPEQGADPEQDAETDPEKPDPADGADADPDKDSDGEAADEEKNEAGKDGEGDETPDWMKSDAKDGEFRPDSDAAAARRKWKGRWKEEKGRAEQERAERERLEQENAKLKEQLAAPKVEATKDAPKREDFDTDDLYIKALAAHEAAKIRSELATGAAAEEKKRQQAEQQAKIEGAVDAHYARAEKLATQSNIKPETYQAADRAVRGAVDSVFPDGGDMITDALIANLGPGSEKVMYHLGVNSAKRKQLVDLLTEDRSGIKAAVFLGQLNATLSAPARRESRAPDPADKVHGDKNGSKGDGAALKRQYDEAQKTGDVQKAFNLRRSAKAKKIDTSDW